MEDPSLRTTVRVGNDYRVNDDVDLDEKDGGDAHLRDDDDDSTNSPRRRGVPPLLPAGRRRMILTDEADEETSSTTVSSLTTKVGSSSTRHQPPRPSVRSVRHSVLPTHAPGRRRRRSSARFLRLSGQHHSRHSRNDGTMTTTTPSSAAQLGELYKQAIRMNAENRINASNSWNLALIENIDQFLLLEEEEEEEQHEDLPRDHRRPENDENRLTLNNAQPTPRRQRVNFTKASCTLDASVKIYSYRVDDVHLSSYKVLANLNRNDQNANHKNADSDNDKNTHPDPDHHNAGNHKKSTHSSTLETNMGA